ncbi:MAG: hypothetical protein F8N37_14440 [Telmatospirillum sp.]|nr:hypothetical protein [Telmatospirillum sp.]
MSAAAPSLTTRLCWLALYGAIGLAGTLIFFWQTTSDGFDHIPGNIGDAKFLIYVCEHWYDVFRGLADWRSPAIFYPERNVLGYSDTLFLYGLPYSLLRRAHFDCFAAYQALVMALPPAGVLGTVWLLRGVLALSRPAAVLGAALFAFGSPMATSIAHGQLQAVAFVPFLLVFLFRALAGKDGRGNGDSGRSHLYGMAFFILFPLLAYTAFYMAWFLALFLATLAALWLAGALLTGRAGEVLVWPRRIAARWISLSGNVAFGLLASIPFVATYLPILKSFSRRPFAEILPMIPTPVDLINVSWDNAVWGSLLQRLAPTLQLRPSFWELDKGIPWLTLALFLATTAHLLLRRGSSRAIAGRLPSPAGDSASPGLFLLLGRAVLVSEALMVRFGDRAAWRLIYELVPGGGAIRSVFRYNILLMLPVAAVAAYGVDRLLARARGTGALLLIGLMALLLAGEQISTHRDILSKREERALLAHVPSPPSSCRTMVVTADRDDYNGWWAPLQLNAMLAAQRFHMPTLNGYSGWTPEGWALHFPTHPDYRKAVAAWATGRGVMAGLCAYHVDTATWSPFTGEAGDPSQNH